MKRFLKRSMACAGACLLAGCGGGGSGPDSMADSSLNGNWFVERQGPQGPVYDNEFLVHENGAQVVFTYCNRMTENLTRAGAQLFDREGQQHYFYVRDATTFASRLASVSDIVIRKRGTSGRFDYGSVTLALPSGENFTASTDVCAGTLTGRYADSLGHEIAPTLLTISLPYRDSFIRMEIAFRQLGNGRYKVTGFEPFVQGGASEVTVSEFYSPGLMTPDGGQAVNVASGTIEVSNYTGAAITLSADVLTVTGMPVKWTAKLRLQQR